MFIRTEYVITEYSRPSKTGALHQYKRQKTVLVFRCDCCGASFNRDKGTMNPKRLNNSVYHVCGNCDTKRFAQSKGVESKRVWDLPVSSLKSIDQL